MPCRIDELIIAQIGAANTSASSISYRLCNTSSLEDLHAFRHFKARLTENSETIKQSGTLPKLLCKSLETSTSRDGASAATEMKKVLTVSARSSELIRVLLTVKSAKHSSCSRVVTKPVDCLINKFPTVIRFIRFQMLNLV